MQTGLRGGDPAREIAHLIDRLMARFGCERVHAARAAGHAISRNCASMPCRPIRSQTAHEKLCPHELRTGQPHLRFGRSGCSSGPSRSRPSRKCRTARRCNSSGGACTHDVAHAEGPERIAMEWWRDDQRPDVTRDYFRVESRQGARVWLYREGLYQDTRPPAALVPARDFRMSMSSIPAAKSRSQAPRSAPPPSYAEFAVTTNFSFLRGASHPEELVVHASAWGLPASASPTATRSPAWCARMWQQAEAGRRLSYHPGRTAGLLRRHARHPRLSVRTAPPGDG